MRTGSGCAAAGTSAKVIHLKDRSFTMLKKDLILRNPLRLLGGDTDEQLNAGQFGAVLARAGVGKTAFLVQLALNEMLHERRVLHISLDDPVHKVTLWYEEVLRHIADQYQIPPGDEVLQTLLPLRFIMTFQVEGFSVPKLQERMTDMTAQNIFSPDMIIIDGLPLGNQAAPTLEALKQLSLAGGFPIWMTVLTHRHEQTDETGLPESFAASSHLFDAVIQLQPRDSKIFIHAIKGPVRAQQATSLLLDPESLLITDH